MSPLNYRFHPRNQSFAWQEGRSAGLRRLTAADRRQFDQSGYCILRGAFNRQEIAAVEAAIDPLELAHEQFLRANGSSNAISATDAITFTGHIVKKSPVLRQFAAHAVICDICHDLIGDNVRLYWDQSVYKKSGKPQEFPWHQDNGYTYVEPQQYLTLWIPLGDVDIDNGCPWLAPGMHRLGTLQHWSTPIGLKCLETVADAVPAPADTGDVIAFSSLAPHRTGPNLRSGTVRKAYILQYAPDGAVAIHDDGTRIPQTDPERQFPILRHGLPT
jgi:ectoine hydroxylase-related dioxygenase (phytanoyl-CoA dioxygenase family)